MNNNTPDIGTRLEPFVDRFLIESLTNARLQLHHPQPAEIALRFDAPWEGGFVGYVTALRADGQWHLYYRGKQREMPDGESEVTCYAQSDDGIHWRRPELGLIEFAGNTRNNIILAGRGICHNFSPFLDSNAGSEEFRFKAVAGVHPEGLYALSSRDGVLWQRLQDAPVFTSEPYAFDSQNVAFWSESEECYVLYFRTWKVHSDGKRGARWVSRATSRDFLHWSEPVEMDAGDTPLEHLYINQTHPYFRAPHLYVATAARFMPGRQIISEEKAEELGVHEHHRHDCSDVVLLTSRGENRYDRTFLESFVRPGPGIENWVARANYPALGIQPTGPAEMSLYIQREYSQTTAHLRRYTLRTDGFASVNAEYSGGEMRTRPFVFEGNELALNVATSAAGMVRVEVQNADGKPLPGFSLDECLPIIGDELARVAQWKGGADVSRFAGQPVRLRFALNDADLYALQFAL